MFGITAHCKLHNTEVPVIDMRMGGIPVCPGDGLVREHVPNHSFLLHFRLVSGSLPGSGRVRTLVAVDAVLALCAGLTGCPAEALSTHTHARAVDSVQADPVPKADVLGFSWAGLALGAKVARTAFSRLKQKDQAGLGQGHTSILWFCPAMVWTSCRWDWMCVRSFDPSWRGWEGWGEQPPRTR